jgi:hypothetical protein
MMLMRELLDCVILRHRRRRLTVHRSQQQRTSQAPSTFNRSALVSQILDWLSYCNAFIVLGTSLRWRLLGRASPFVLPGAMVVHQGSEVFVTRGHREIRIFFRFM